MILHTIHPGLYVFEKNKQNDFLLSSMTMSQFYKLVIFMIVIILRIIYINTRMRESGDGLSLFLYYLYF